MELGNVFFRFNSTFDGMVFSIQRKEFNIFFVKQKTAYELRISDWSSDVCSSDRVRGSRRCRQPTPCSRSNRRSPLSASLRSDVSCNEKRRARGGRLDAQHAAQLQLVPRSEEHTSELQSLMRISYAVFCLTKKKKTTTHQSEPKTKQQKQHKT